MSTDSVRRAAVELRATVHGCNANPALVADAEFKLAVAAMLDNAAEDAEMQAPEGPLRPNWDMRIHIAANYALAAARAYLGEPPDPGPATPSPVAGPVSNTPTTTENRDSA